MEPAGKPEAAPLPLVAALPPALAVGAVDAEFDRPRLPPDGAITELPEPVPPPDAEPLALPVAVPVGFPPPDDPEDPEDPDDEGPVPELCPPLGGVRPGVVVTFAAWPLTGFPLCAYWPGQGPAPAFAQAGG